MRIRHFVIAATVALATPVAAHAQTIEKSFSKAAVAGRTSALGDYYGVTLDCTPIDWVDVPDPDPDDDSGRATNRRVEIRCK